MSKKIMKRSLALGALMAFVITGSAMAADLVAQGQTTMLSNSDQTYQNGRIIGGYEFASGSGSHPAETFSTNITIGSGIYDEVLGGSHLRKVNNSNGTGNVNISSTSVVINGGTISNVEDIASPRLIGGSKINNVDYANVNIGSTKVVVNGGTIYGGIIGGNFVKAAGQSDNIENVYTCGHAENTTNVGTSTVIINGGEIKGHVFGGDVAQQYHTSSNQNINLSVHNDKTELFIRNAEISGYIFGAGAAIGEVCSSTVNNVYMDINGGTYTEDIYSGGLLVDPNGDKGVSVNEAVVNISDANIASFHASDGYATWNDDKPHGINGGSLYGLEIAGQGDAVSTNLTLTDVTATGEVDVRNGSVILSATADGETKIDTLTVGEKVDVSMEADGATNDSLNGNVDDFVDNFEIGTYVIKDEEGNTVSANDKSNINGRMRAGKVVGDIDFTLDEDGKVATFNENENPSNAGIKNMAAIGLMSWRAETNDMNKRMGELRNANGEHGVWVRMVRGEDEYGSVKNQYNQYQLGYDEKLSVDKRWTVGAALSYTDAENNFAQGSGESTNKALSIYGSKLNDDGTFIDLIAKYARLENDFVVNGGAGNADYSTNGYSLSAEFGKRIQQGGGVWIEPQVELTYGKVSAVDYVSKNGVKVAQDGMDSIVGRLGFSLGKDIKQGNVYARASYLYDFDGETKGVFSDGNATRTFEDDLGGGWWEVGVGTNINLSKSTYIYADVEKTFGGDVDTNWQWNLGVRYSF